jgi:hypothetical protein
MATFIDGNTSSKSRSLLNINTALNPNIKFAAVDYYKFQLLYNKVYNKLTTAMKYYSENNYEELLKVFNDNEIPTLMTTITNDGLYNNDNINNLINIEYDIKLFNKYRTATLDLLTGLQGSIQIQEKNKLLTQDISGLKIYEQALNTKNQDFILTYMNNNLNYVQTPTDIINAFELDIEIQPWYMEYLKQWGPPANGVFDLDKLSAIVTTLIDTNQITLDQFLNNNL